jgi:Raf kinase inhibitor-like YbhB/YbcL family protein
MHQLHRFLNATVAVSALVLTATSGAHAQAAKSQKAKSKAVAHAASFKVSAPDFITKGRVDASHVFNGMGCTGQNISPALQWSNPPAGTKSFAVTMYDPDAPTGSGWWHWVMYNIPANVTGLAAGAGNGRNAPRGSAQGPTDFGTRGYGGPCPPPGDKPHHYHLTVFALKVDKLDIPGNGTAAMVGFNLHANTLAKAQVTGLYAR